MSEAKLHPVSREWAERAYINAEKYREMYRRSVDDPDGFWAEQAGRLDWIKAPATVRNVSLLSAPICSVTSVLTLRSRVTTGTPCSIAILTTGVSASAVVYRMSIDDVVLDQLYSGPPPQGGVYYENVGTFRSEGVELRAGIIRGAFSADAYYNRYDSRLDDRRIEMALPSIKSVLGRGGKLVLIPVNTHTWAAHVPQDAPPVVKSLLARLLTGRLRPDRASASRHQGRFGRPDLRRFPVRPDRVGHHRANHDGRSDRRHHRRELHGHPGRRRPGHCR